MPDGNKAKAAVWASLAADSLALGPHWEYNVERLRQTHGRVETLRDPVGFYHKGKKAGEFTHYGDQVYVLLESVAAKGGFDLADFFERWKALFDGYGGYLDGATRNTLSRIEFGEGPETSGAASHDLAGAARMAPLLLVAKDMDDFVAMARAQTRMTHNNPLVLESAEFFARATWLAMEGAGVVEAMHEAAKADYASTPVQQWLDQGLATAGQDTTQAIGGLGQSCDVDGGFQGVVHLLARYPDDLKGCLVECVMAGGDSAARGLMAGMVLGARLGPEAVPVEWTGGLAVKQAVEDMLAEF